MDILEMCYRLKMAMNDDKLKLSERQFLTWLVVTLAETGEHSTHMTMEEYRIAAHLGNGTIAEVIPRLIERGHIRGVRTPKADRGYESWRLSLPELPSDVAPNRRTIVEHVSGYRVMVMIEPEWR